MEFKIEKTEVYGLSKSVIASGNAMRTEMDRNDTSIFIIDEYTDEQRIEDRYEPHFKRACNLGTTKSGEGHDNFLNGIIVQFDIYAPLYMWKQLQRYHFLDFISSQSTMHRLTKFNVSECCVDDVDELILNRYQDLLNEYNNIECQLKSTLDALEMETLINKRHLSWRTLVASLPSGFVLGATMTTNYRQLKTIYNQRKNHKLDEWHKFCEWCESLPHFKELCVRMRP